jgi:uncharacterized protein YndB with AHSA1/START domain
VAASLALMGLRADAGLSRSSIEIEAPPEQVWRWIEDEDKFKQWVAWVVSVEEVHPGVKGVGRKTVTTMKEPGSAEPVRIESTWTEYMPPSRMSADVAFPGLFTGSQSYELTSLGPTRTKVQIETRIHYKSWLVRLLEPLATPSSTQKNDQDLAALKRLIETGQATASAALEQRMRATR